MLTVGTNIMPDNDDNYEKTEIVYGTENLLKFALEDIRRAKRNIDLFGGKDGPPPIIDGPSLIMSTEPAYLEFKEASSRGIKQRHLTEITSDNIAYCKKLMEFQELRHMQGVKGHLVIRDGELIVLHAFTGSPPSLTHGIVSTVKVLVHQQQNFFDVLWEKAIPAELRLREIEEGVPTTKIELIQDTESSIRQAFEMTSRAKDEVLILFPAAKTFTIAMMTELAKIYRSLSNAEVKVKTLIPAAIEKENNVEFCDCIAKLKASAPFAAVKVSDTDLKTSMMLIVSDRKEFMSWELKDNTVDDPRKAGGISTYSNLKSLASSYATIFDNLWKITDMVDELHATNFRLEKNEKAMKEFIDIAAHELRTPIQPILGLSEIVQELGPISSEQKKMLKIIIRNANRLDRLADQILDVTRIEREKLIISKQRVDVEELVRGVVQDYHNALIKNKEDDTQSANLTYQGISQGVNEDKSSGSGLTVLGDPERLMQVMSNLLSNALKFSMSGGTIEVTVTRRTLGDLQKDYAEISVSDEGVGIDPKILPRLFEKFVSKSAKGIGLGLYLSKKIVEAHGGRIWAENNREGRGASFTFVLPLAS